MMISARSLPGLSLCLSVFLCPRGVSRVGANETVFYFFKENLAGRQILPLLGFLFVPVFPNCICLVCLFLYSLFSPFFLNWCKRALFFLLFCFCLFQFIILCVSQLLYQFISWSFFLELMYFVRPGITACASHFFCGHRRVSGTVDMHIVGMRIFVLIFEWFCFWLIFFCFISTCGVAVSRMFFSSSCSGRVVPVSFCKTIATSDFRQARPATFASRIIIDLRPPQVAFFFLT